VEQCRPCIGARARGVLEFDHHSRDGRIQEERSEPHQRVAELPGRAISGHLEPLHVRRRDGLGGVCGCGVRFAAADEELRSCRVGEADQEGVVV